MLASVAPPLLPRPACSRRGGGAGFRARQFQLQRTQAQREPRSRETHAAEKSRDTVGKHSQRKASSGGQPTSSGSSPEPPKPQDPAAKTGGGNAKLVASLGAVGGLALLIGGGVVFKGEISTFITYFISLVDDLGPLGFVAYGLVYAGLELLAVPAIPLTMTAGAIFGVGLGTAVVSVAATAACTGAFLIARYLARDRVLQYAQKNPKFAAIDRAIGRDGFRVVVLLRLSPLLPLAASNYLYGLTSVDLGSYVLGSWLGMLPGTAAYVTAGKYGKQLLDGGGAVESPQWWQVGIALGASAVAVGYIGRLAQNAMAEIDADEQEKH